MRSFDPILNQLGIKTKSGRPVHRYKSSSKVFTHKSILHILTAFCSLLILFTPPLAQAANYLVGNAYNQNNTGTAAGGSFSGSVIQTYNFTTIDLTNVDPAGQGNHYSLVIEGFIYASVDGTYQFETYTDDGIRVIVDGTLVINNWTDHGPTINTGSTNLLTGWIPVRIEHYEKGGGQRLRFRWKPPGDSNFSYPTAADLSNEDLPDPTNGNTTLVAAPTSVVADGSTTSSVTVTLADASGNLLTASGGTVALSSTGSATIGAVTDNGDGTYTATVTNTVAESVTISGTLDGAAITDTATVTFTVGLSVTTSEKSPREEFLELEDDIRNEIKFNTNININLFLKTTNTAVSSARDRYISNRMMNSSSKIENQFSEGPVRLEKDGSNTASNSEKTNGVIQIDNDTENSFNLRSSTRGTVADGQINTTHKSLNGKVARYTGTKFNFTKSENKAKIGSATSQVIFEQKKSDELTIGYFMGSSLSRYSKSEQNTTSLDTSIDTIGLQFGGYFIHNVTEGFFLDGYLAGSLLLNKLELTTDSISAESDYFSKMRAIGVAATGLLKLNRWEIRPTLALDYSDVFSNNAKFTVVTEVESSDELMLLSSERQKSFTFSPDFRRSFGYFNSDKPTGPIFSFKPKVTCRANYRETVSKECGQGATISLTSQPQNNMETFYFLIGMDKISYSTTYSANALYKVEF